MSSQEIVDYVMNTPHNTNPAILKSMIDTNSSSGVTSWNDLTDKPFGEEKSEITIVEDYEIENGDFIEYYYTVFCGVPLRDTNTPDITFSEGDEVIIDFAGVRYQGILKEYTGTNGYDGTTRSCLGYGNPTLCMNDVESTEDNYFVSYRNGKIGVYLSEDPGRQMISAYANMSVIKTLDPKYLPSDHINHLIDAKLEVIENGTY